MIYTMKPLNRRGESKAPPRRINLLVTAFHYSQTGLEEGGVKGLGGRQHLGW